MDEKLMLPVDRRGSQAFNLRRTASYSVAIGTEETSSIEIPNLRQSEVYTNEEYKKVYPVKLTNLTENAQFLKSIGTPVTEEETSFSAFVESQGIYNDCVQYLSQSEDTDEETPKGLMMRIDVETAADLASSKSGCFNANLPSPLESNSSKQPLIQSVIHEANEEDLNRIESDTFSYTYSSTINESSMNHSMRYSSKRKKSGRLRHRNIVRPQRSRRVVFKDGEENVPIRTHIPAKSVKYMRDIVNTVINSKWRFILCLMVVSHFVFWLIFAGIWYAVSNSYREEMQDNKEHCVNGTSSFAGMLMLAVETQMTIGYGVRYPNEECPEAIAVMVIEIIAGTAMSGGLSSLLFAKLVRPHKYLSSVGFSKKATVYLRDGELCLTFRVWDLMFLHTIGSTISAYLLKPIRTLEGESQQNFIHQLELKGSNWFLFWPICLVHVIDSKSPLYDVSAQDMMDYRFEIVVCLTGASISMGTMTQSRTSYLSKEIMWGYRFINVMKYDKEKESYIIDRENLNTLEEVETPLCSARKLKEFEEDIKSSRNLLTMSNSPTDITLPKNFSEVSSSNSISLSPTFTELGSIQKSSPGFFKRSFRIGSGRRID